MRRTLSAFFTVALAALLSLVLAVPSHADQWSDYLKDPNNPRYKYSFNYYKMAFRPSGTTAPPAVGVGPSLPVPETINPSNTGGSYYLNQIKNARAINPANVPLEGKIIVPGQTVVRAPTTYGPVAKFVGTGGAIGLSRIIGTAGVGIGGTSVAPANANQLALAKGVSQGCIDNGATCTSAEQKTRFMIGSCGQFSGADSCDSIGALGPNGETQSANWLRDDVFPFLDGLWAALTGQASNKTPSDEHIDVSLTRGCYRSFNVEYRGSNNITFHGASSIVAGRPTDTSQGIYWDGQCSPAQLAAFTPQNTVAKVTCLDQDGRTANNVNQSYGVNTPFSASTINTDGTNKNGLCNVAGNPGKTLTLFRVQVINTAAVATFTPATAGTYSVTQFTEWTNPDKNLDTIEDTKITTTWTCRTGDGTLYNFTKTVTKISAAPVAQCPAGSDLVKHDVKATDGNTTTTLDSGAENPAEAAKYPLCLGGGSPGCTMDIWVDGSKCTVARTECQNWPALSSTSPSRVQCHWGTYTITTGNCNALSNGYKTETGVVFDPHSGTWVGVDAYGNPLPANPEPWNPTNPTPITGANPGTTTPPATGTGTGTSGFPTTGTSPSNNCDAPSWSWNPVEFVHNPVVCALKDAFVPKTDIKARMSKIGADANTTAPIAWINNPIVGPSGGGCPNWVVNVAGLSRNVVCGSSFTGAIVGSRGAMFGIVASAMIWPLIRGIWYALIPIVRVTPSGSK